MGLKMSLSLYHLNCQQKITKKMLMTLQKLTLTAMNNVLLISEKTIKENSLVSDNVDGKYIQNAIKTA